MKTLLYALLFVFVSLAAAADTGPQNPEPMPNDPAAVCEQPAVTAAAEADGRIEEARRGCCSWHDGVCGCDRNVGRLICCDGTYSPSCGC
jgi:hypothetical protein